MASTISGNLYFDRNITGTGAEPISNVEIVLQNISDQKGIVVKTDNLGAFKFTNVPSGNYIIVESFGFSEGFISTGTGDYGLNSSVISIPTGKDPTVAYITNPQTNANTIFSVTPNTLNQRVNGISNYTGIIFRDGPYRLVPLSTKGVTRVGSNIITQADKGTWGTLPAGTPMATNAATLPYPNVSSGATFSPTGPPEGSYIITNMFTRVANVLTGDETGRYQEFNAGPTDGIIFKNTANVTPNTDYEFATWWTVLNAQPNFKLEATTLGGTVLSSQLAPNQNATIPRVWYQLGTYFNTGNNTVINTNIVGLASPASGYDYIIDAITLYEVSLGSITANKTVDKNFAKVGDILTYSIVIDNSYNITYSNVQLLDTIPTGTVFLSNSLALNSATITGANPAPPLGANIGTLPANTISTVSFKVIVTTIPSNNTIINNASFNINNIGVNTNSITTTIKYASCSGITKYVDKSYANCGDILNYTIVVPNSGNATALNVRFQDTIPNGTSFISDSFKYNGFTLVNTNPNLGINIANISPGEIITLNYKVIINC